MKATVTLACPRCHEPFKADFEAWSARLLAGLPRMLCDGCEDMVSTEREAA